MCGSGVVLLVVQAAVAAKKDAHANCQQWAEMGECEKNPTFMQDSCAASCSGARSYSDQMRRECAGYAQQGGVAAVPLVHFRPPRGRCCVHTPSLGDRDSVCAQSARATRPSCSPRAAATARLGRRSTD